MLCCGKALELILVTDLRAYLFKLERDSVEVEQLGVRTVRIGDVASFKSKFADSKIPFLFDLKDFSVGLC